MKRTRLEMWSLTVEQVEGSIPLKRHDWLRFHHICGARMFWDQPRTETPQKQKHLKLKSVKS